MARKKKKCRRKRARRGSCHNDEIVLSPDSYRWGMLHIISIDPEMRDWLTEAHLAEIDFPLAGLV